MKKYLGYLDFWLNGDDVDANSPESIEVNFKPGSNVSFTGRSISTKRVISQNVSVWGDKTTVVMKKWDRHRKQNDWRYLFYPVNDIYLDYNHTDMIMPKGRPIYVVRNLYSEIIPSRKYPKCYVLAPDSDVETIFKEVSIPNVGIGWVLTYEKATLHLIRHYEGPTHAPTKEDIEDESNYYYMYVSKHLKKWLKDNEFRDYEQEAIDAYRSYENWKEAQAMTDELFEEAGYDFMD